MDFIETLAKKYKITAGKELDKFIAYCMKFYGEGGLYPIQGIKPEMIKDAVGELALTDHKFGGGDSFDREKVRDVILKQLGQKPRNKLD